jgi:hypothetical protein
VGLQKRVEELERALGLIPGHTPRRSPESNGLAEAFFGSFKTDYVYQACLETLVAVGRQVPQWIDHYNRQAPHSALGMRAPAEFYADWMAQHKELPVQNQVGQYNDVCWQRRQSAEPAPVGRHTLCQEPQ